ncbi:MAG: host attachment protein [Gammaproteobacteria bacterium]|nr:host attachment protein [Gammaproteobacteria bacterium]
MAYTWVVVADSTRARIFSAESSSAGLSELETLAHPEGRMHDRDITSDLPGRSFDSNKAGGRHAMEPSTDPKQELAIEFARTIARHVDAARVKNDFEQLVIVAAPTFLGLLREQLSNTCRKLVAFELNKNLVQQPAEEIRSHLPKLIPAIS